MDNVRRESTGNKRIIKRRYRLLACLCAVMMCLSPCAVFGAQLDGQDMQGASDLAAQTAGDAIADTAGNTDPEDTADGAAAADIQETDADKTLEMMEEPADTAEGSVDEDIDEEQPEGEIIEAGSMDEYIELTEPDMDNAAFDVNKSTGEITGTDDDLEFDETFDRSFDSVKGNHGKMINAIENTEGYQVCGESKKKIHVLSDYGLRRVIVSEELQDTYGAETAVVYDGETVLTYDSEESTKEGYDTLTGTFGEDRVVMDFLISTDQTMQFSSTADSGIGEITAQDSNTASPNGWGTKAMFLDYQMQKYEECDQDVTIAVLDSGINENHEIFKDTNILEESRSFLDTSVSYKDDNGHGTMVSGVIAESTTSNVSLLVLKVMNEEGVAVWSSVQLAMRYAAEQDADIINLSFGGYKSEAACNTADSFMAEIAGQGILICAASGNEYQNIIKKKDGERFFPATSPYTISVGAIQSNGKRASFSNYGTNLDFVAPGAGLTLADFMNKKGSEYRTDVQGTSFACPYICACAAFLMMSDEDNTADTVHGQMIQISDDLGEEGKDIYYGNGMPNFANDASLAPIEITGTPKVTVETTKYAYDGKVKRPSVTVTYEGRTLTSYNIEYPDESPEIGTHKVKVTLVGNYTDTIKVVKTFKIVPKTVSINLNDSAFYSNGTSGKLKLKWSKSQGTYQVKLATNKSFKNAKTYPVKSNSKIISGLKAGKTYYIKVRAVKKVDGKKYCSAWSQTVHGTILKY